LRCFFERLGGCVNKKIDLLSGEFFLLEIDHIGHATIDNVMLLKAANVPKRQNATKKD
jgi:hypothetical protein